MAKDRDGTGPDLAACALQVLAATTVPAAASAILSSLAECGLHADAVLWQTGDHVACEPTTAELPLPLPSTLAALLQAQGVSCHVLHSDADGPQAVLVAAPDSLSQISPAAAGVLRLGTQRLAELLTLQNLQASVQHLEQSRQLQQALFAMADLASSDQDMDSMLRGLHDIIGRLMYARNFFIALYEPQRDSLRFIYFADEVDEGMYDPEQEIPASELKESFTLAIIRQARSVRGPAWEVARQLGIVRGPVMGTPSVDFMGVPMRRGAEVLGAIAVQSYREGLGYTESDSAVLGFVAEHVLTALERKHGRQALERRVQERTRELAQANEQLQAQVAERERAAHLQATLYRIAALANGQESDDQFYRSLHAAVGELINAENFYIALVSEDGSTLHFPYCVDVAGEGGKTRPMARGLSEYVMRQGQTQLVDTGRLEQLRASGEVAIQSQTGTTATVCWLGAPLLGAQGVMGVVTVQSYRPDLMFGEQDAALLTFVSHQIATSVQRRQQAEALHALNSELEQRVQQRTQELRQEIAMREQVEARLQHEVMHDPLTGLPNRVYLRDRLERALATHRRDPQRGFALLYLDVDRFKLFNDSLGHQAGDIVLREVARRLLQCVRTPDVAARLSGDEFAILLEDGPQPATACKIAQRIQTCMQEMVQVGDRALRLSVSIGIAVGRTHHKTIDELLHDADVALYRAKEGGRQRFVLFDDREQRAAMDVLQVEQELRDALQTAQIVPHFQPIVRLADGQVVGYETLVRWQHPVRGLLAPGDFLPIAEQTGLIESVDWHLYGLACEAGAPLVHEGGFLTLNVSARHFANGDFDRSLLALLRRTGFDPARLHIEVTESTLLGDPAAVAAILQRLKDAGVGTALDDFGTGYSSLGHVHRFPLSMIKIDRSFTGELDKAQPSRSVAIIDAVLSLGRALNLDVVAEGVETDAQRQVLLAMGCVYGQGYHFGRPAPAAHWVS
ncbi:EAL domain-containing protein [Acidovorax sp. FHTAMBA]|uniref:bifunctional diguanylate cyclase/phosphodiesterase n=1 Tax=Acidovorax sp. FHTAMBA TaxID=3140252 RepID=UPI003182C0AD